MKNTVLVSLRIVLPFFAVLIAAVIMCPFTAASEVSLSSGEDFGVLKYLAHTRYLEGTPIVILAAQNRTEEPDKSDLLNVDNIILKDESWEDLSLDLTPSMALGDFRTTVTVEEEGVYEVFLKKEIIPANKVLTVGIEIDRNMIPPQALVGLNVFYHKYVRIADIVLSQGKHTIRIHAALDDGPFVCGSSNIFLVKKNKRLENQSLIDQLIRTEGKGLCYIFEENNGTLLIPQAGTYELSIEGELRSNPYDRKEKLFSSFKEPRLRSLKVVAIDEQIFTMSDFEIRDGQRGFLIRPIALSADIHRFRVFPNPYFNVKLILIDKPVSAYLRSRKPQNPQPTIIYTRVNPTKYVVRIRAAQDPFWLVFNETFNDQWKVYGATIREAVSSETRAGESKHGSMFSVGDIRYLFRQPLRFRHATVNGYANAWYIDPRRLSMGTDFAIVLIFGPQLFFYVGLVVSGLTLIVCGILYFAFKGRQK